VSRCIDLFIDAPVDLDEFAVGLARLTGLAFAKHGDNAEGAEDLERPQYLTHQGDVVLTLGEHDFVDDRQLLLSSYRYDLYARVSTDQVLDSPEAHLLRQVLSLVRAEGRHPALLVFDLQRVIDRADGSRPAATKS
jgi:hypothetical protein